MALEEGLPFLRFSIEGYEVFLSWRMSLERRLRGSELHPAMEAHFAKYRKLVPALALICHLADSSTGPVAALAVQRAVDWASYLETHARRAYGSVTAASVDTAKAILDKIRSGHLKSEFRSWDIWRPGWSRLTDREAVQAGLDILVEHAWLHQRRIETMGRRATVYSVNPKM
jgi:putative DNA primase/helicase